MNGELLAPLYEAALDLSDFCQSKHWQFCFIGGIAVQRWGEPRFTRDADLSLLAGFEGEVRFIDPLLDRYAPRIGEARAFALENRVLLLRHENGTPLDIALAAFPFEQEVIGRATEFATYVGRPIPVCSAEDLIVYKAFASRDRDWADLEGVVQRQGSAIDRAVVIDRLIPLVEIRGDPSIVPKLENVFEKWGK